MGAPRDNERGVALLVVLLLVAAMATAAVLVMEDLRFGVRRSTNMAAMAQARWYALGAEAFAGAQIRRLSQRNPDQTTLEGDWNGRVLQFPIDGGRIVVRVRDGANCFNLNRLADPSADAEAETGGVEAGAGDTPPPTPMEGLAQRQFRAFLAALGVSGRAGGDIVDAVTDWVDPDQARTGAGWEDDRYAKAAPAYRTGGGPLAEASELRAIAPITPEIYALIRPHVCALPAATAARINLNTLSETDAPLLVALSAGALSLNEARQLIRQRPDGGWTQRADFWALPSFAGRPVPKGAQNMTDVRTRYFALEVRVVYLDVEAVSSALLEDVGGDRVTTRLRRWTIDE